MSRNAKFQSNFVKCERGSATIEAVLWLPMFFGLFILMADSALIFNGQSQIMRIIQDGNRNYSIGRLTSETETETYIEAALANYGPGLGASTVVTNGVITTTVTVPAGDLTATKMLKAISAIELRIASQHLMER